jgi:hypothetical protein
MKDDVRIAAEKISKLLFCDWDRGQFLNAPNFNAWEELEAVDICHCILPAFFPASEAKGDDIFL